MPLTYSATPPVGVTPGDLRVDSASRTLWLGVDTSVDPDGALLISDIVALEAEIAASEAAANAYTDTQVATRAPLAHTHVAADITDFAAEVADVANSLPQLSWVPGMIVMWSGSLIEIGVGALVGWALCDGAGGRPDLRSKFIIGAGHLAVGSGNPLSAAPTQPAGGHAHGGNTSNTTLTLQQIPSHLHGDGTLAGVANGNTGQGGQHDHDYTYYRPIASGNGLDGTLGSVAAATGTTDSAPNHTHPIVNLPVAISGSTANSGGGAAHAHPIPVEADHVHQLTSNNLRDATPYFALAFIIKLP
jgi:hypothetical protein